MFRFELGPLPLALFLVPSVTFLRRPVNESHPLDAEHLPWHPHQLAIVLVRVRRQRIEHVEEIKISRRVVLVLVQRAIIP